MNFCNNICSFAFAALLIAPFATFAQGLYEVGSAQYPLGTDNGKTFISVFRNFDHTDEQILANAMLWAIENTCTKERDQMFDINIGRKTFSFNVLLKEDSGVKTKYFYKCKVNVRIAEGKMICNVYDITYKKEGLLSSDAPIERLNSEKPKQKEILDAFQRQASGMINRLSDAVAENKCGQISHWSEISLQRPEKGMTESECLLAFGKPQNIYESDSERVQWSYSLYFVLIFKDGVVDTIIR